MLIRTLSFEEAAAALSAELEESKSSIEQSECTSDCSSHDVGDSGENGQAGGKRKSVQMRGRLVFLSSPKLPAKKKTKKKDQDGQTRHGFRQNDPDSALLTPENFANLLANRDLLLAELVKPGLRLVRGLMTVVSATTDDSNPDALCQALVAIADSNEQTNQLMKIAIAHELNNRTSPLTLFREDSLCTKFLSTYAREKGGTYRRSVLHPVVKKVVNSRTSYEMDPLRITSDKLTPPEENQRKLRKLCQKVLDAIFSRHTDFPLQIISRHLYTEVNKKFPLDGTGPRAWSPEDEGIDEELAFRRSSDWGMAYVGTFIFLRFFCPAIVSPNLHGIVDRVPTPEAQRGLMLVAKTLQTMANQLRFGEKEAYMKPMNNFIEENQPRLEEYLRHLIQKSPQTRILMTQSDKEKKSPPTMRDQPSSSLSISSPPSPATNDRASTGSLSSGTEQFEAHLNAVQACCTRHQRKLLTFYYSSSLPFCTLNTSAGVSPPTKSSAAAATNHKKPWPIVYLASQASATLHSESSMCPDTLM